eukprot:gb/GECG01015961.1/.p1 GENE.gb/GECG01015961.1/~~gb/GECG01015961.1/.p1  ORF type:complete len:551 (+),score=52.87 gb/GECG01015961.1/:1-1653(+)
MAVSAQPLEGLQSPSPSPSPSPYTPRDINIPLSAEEIQIIRQGCKGDTLNEKVAGVFARHRDYGIDCLDMGGGMNPLHIATNVGAHDFITALVEEYEAQVDLQDRQGWTALHYAAFNGETDIVSMLVNKYCARAGVLNHAGYTPLELAWRAGTLTPELEAYLEENFADPPDIDDSSHMSVGSVDGGSVCLSPGTAASDAQLGPLDEETEASFSLERMSSVASSASGGSRRTMRTWSLSGAYLTKPTPEDISRARGCLLGTAIGDALGVTLEDCPARNPFNPVLTDIVGGGSFRLDAGQWTDDTSMMLCLAKSLLACRRLSQNDQLRRYWRWLSKGENSSTGRAFSVGTTCLKGIKHFVKTGKPYSGGRKPNAAGNGSLMRLAPVPVAASSIGTAMDWAGEQSRTTHSAKEAVEACQVMSAFIFLALRGETKDAILSNETVVNKRWTTRIRKIVKGSYKEKEPPDIKGTRYVVNTLEAVLWAFYKTETFRDGLILVVNLGNDADTTGAIYGALAGAYYGLEAIPRRWREVVYWSEDIQQIADELCRMRRCS